ncbi:LCI fold-containing protein [Bacillus wiedmannii]|nr:LCI fold-containing protein [Bacillus wiedmannii]
MYSESGKFANYFESDGIKWYFKGVALEFVNGGAYGHYEGIRSN